MWGRILPSIKKYHRGLTEVLYYHLYFIPDINIGDLLDIAYSVGVSFVDILKFFKDNNIRNYLRLQMNVQVIMTMIMVMKMMKMIL